VITFGSQLYTLSERDELSVQLETVNQFSSALMPISTASVNFSLFTTPRDRMLYVNNICIWNEPTGGALAMRWRSVELRAVSPDGLTQVPLKVWQAETGIADDSGVPSRVLALRIDPRILLPRGWSLSVLASRQDSTLGVQLFASLEGMLVPPGNVARSS
jgi:hypothetical protein